MEIPSTGGAGGGSRTPQPRGWGPHGEGTGEPRDPMAWGELGTPQGEVEGAGGPRDPQGGLGDWRTPSTRTETPRVG